MTDALPSRAAFDAQWAALRAWIVALPPGAEELPSALDGWTVGDLVAHLGRAVDLLARAGAAEPGAEPLSIGAYVSAYPGVAPMIAQGTRELSRATADDRLAAVDASFAVAASAIDGFGGEGRRVVQATRGPIRADDLVKTRILELVVHADDLARSLPDLPPPAHDDGALRIVVKLLLDALAQRAPGRTVEVRVPPYAVVQCVEGASHTRGTPPNVVETDGLSWIRVACGRVAWTDLVESGALHASGIHANDVAEHLPLL